MRKVNAVGGLVAAALVAVSSAVACSDSDKPGNPSAPLDDTGVLVTDSSPADTATGSDDGVDATPGETEGDTSSSETATDAVSADTTDADELDGALPETCSTPYIAFGTKDLVAGGATPKAFADAWNAEVAKLSYPGPLLMAFTGIDGKDASKWILKLGPLEAAGADVKFATTPASVPYTLGKAIQLQVTEAPASFVMRFTDGTTTTDIPALGLSMTASAAGCTELSVDKIQIGIPASAKDVPFAGSTVGALMGPPLSGGDAGAGGAYLLELLGSTTKVTVAGGVP